MAVHEDYIQEHSSTLGNHGARIKTLEDWRTETHDVLELAKSTAQTVRFQVKLSWALLGTMILLLAKTFLHVG